MVMFHSSVSLPEGKPPFSYGFPIEIVDLPIENGWKIHLVHLLVPRKLPNLVRPNAEVGDMEHTFGWAPQVPM